MESEAMIRTEIQKRYGIEPRTVDARGTMASQAPSEALQQHRSFTA